MTTTGISIKRSEIDRVLAVASNATQVPIGSLTGPSRARRVVAARNATAAALRRLWELPYAQLGAVFDGRDHGTMIHAVRNADPALVDELVELAHIDDIAGPMVDAFGRPTGDYCRVCGLSGGKHWAGCPHDGGDA